MLRRAIRTSAVVAAILVASATASAFQSDSGDKGSLQRELNSLYPPLVIKAGWGKLNVAQRTGLLIVNKPGIGLLHGSLSFHNEYRDGQIKQGSGSNLLKSKGGDTDVQVGDKVYLSRIVVKAKGKDPSITFWIESCGNCDFSPITETPWRATVVFPFPEGALDKPDMATIRQTISEVFTVVSDTPAAAPTESADVPQSAPADPPHASKEIRLGQSRDEVITALGQPERKATVGEKEILFYKDMKVTLQNGRVSDVQ